MVQVIVSGVVAASLISLGPQPLLSLAKAVKTIIFPMNKNKNDHPIVQQPCCC